MHLILLINGGASNITAQITDNFLYRGSRYALAGISEGNLFSPQLFGLKPRPSSTACWRGYQAVFRILNNRLVLADLYINFFKEGKEFISMEGPEINGIRPVEPDEMLLFKNFYKGLNYQLDYSGGILIANGFIEELYVHMGFHPAWKYKRVTELIFDKGYLKQEIDQSKKMAELRKKLQKINRGSEFRALTRAEIDAAFDRTYNSPVE